MKAFSNFLVKWLVYERPPHEVPMSDFSKLRFEVKPGDVILIEGRSRVSEVIKLITQSRWSHAAIYIGKIHDIEHPMSRQRIKSFYDGQPDVQLIIESELGLGTIVRPLSVYDRDHIRVCRPRDLTYRDAQKIINYAVSKLGNDYDVRQIFDLARLLFPWTVMPRRWRSSLFTRHPGKNTKTVCSTMIAEAFASVQYPILPLVKRSGERNYRYYRRNPKLCTPSDFDYSPYFDIIKYPFAHLSDSPAYRQLPWSIEEEDPLIEQTASPTNPPDGISENKPRPYTTL
ncbi:hypothetical protein OLMES_2143 [Oleiphilus messinensis]|uniref:Permuted papain-like amidase enzyme, YaeF/YiiX, C92 family n=1 Tax=Oleiphilus messinensis TaxID=141451 RepID=A0A1Y0I8X6_9GAMM|nr:YiiX/YebB-like N1pC/P60 family cysteine hydrolase [Oleiphilus messinensis]ARU56216.1 hypothetical protein OLMES_2143 [Oleiphilus messinensis]